MFQIQLEIDDRFTNVHSTVYLVECRYFCSLLVWYGSLLKDDNFFFFLFQEVDRETPTCNCGSYHVAAD